MAKKGPSRSRELKRETVKGAEVLIKLTQAVERLIAVIDDPTKLIHKIEQQNGMLDIVAKKHSEILGFLGRVHFPADAIEALTGELRAVRILLDKDREYSFLDKKTPKTEESVGAPGGSGQPIPGLSRG